MEQQRHAFSLHIRDKFHQLDINLILSHSFLTELKAANAIHPLHEEFSLQEDRLLLFVEVSIKLQEDENGEEKVLTGKDLVKAYKSKSSGKKKDNPFTKIGWSGKQFKARLSELRTNGGTRLSVLLSSVNAEVDAMRRDQIKQEPILDVDDEPKEKEAPSKMNALRAKMLGAALNNPMIGTRARKSSVAYGGKPFSPNMPITSDSNETLVEVVLSGRNFEQTTVCTLERHLANCSAMLKKLLETTAPQFSPALGEPVKQIAFSEYDKKYRDHDMYDCFNPINFNRFVMFVEHPDLQESYKESQEKMKNFHAQNQKEIGNLVNSLIERKDKKIRDLEEKNEKERSELHRVLKKCKDFDIERLNTMYEVHIQNETEKLEKTLETRKKDVEIFYEREVKEIQQLFKQQQQRKLTELEAEISDTQALINKILPKDDPHLISLLILSDIVKAEELRSCCIRLITEDANRFETVFRDNEAWSNSFIQPETLQLLMAHLPTPCLKSLSTKYDYHFDRQHALREIEYRKRMLADDYKETKIEDLMKIQEEGESIFPDILEREIARRRNKKPFVYMDPKYLSPFLGVADDQVTVSLKGCNRYSSGIATLCKQFNGWGKWFFEVEIIDFPRPDTTSISIGWDTYRGNNPINYDGPIPGMTAGERNQFGYSWQNDGMFHFDGKGEHCSTEYTQGDVIGCAINQDKKLISFYKNGVKIVLLRRETTKKGTNKKSIQEIHSVTISDPNYKLYPSICLFSPKKNVECVVRFNFSGPFKCEVPPLHEPYGDERKVMRQQLEQKQLNMKDQNYEEEQSGSDNDSDN